MSDKERKKNAVKDASQNERNTTAMSENEKRKKVDEIEKKERKKVG